MSYLPSQFNTFHCGCYYHSNSGVLMNIFNVNDQIEFYLEKIDAACGAIILAVDDSDDIESAVKTIHKANDQLRRELAL